MLAVLSRAADNRDQYRALLLGFFRFIALLMLLIVCFNRGHILWHHEIQKVKARGVEFCPAVTHDLGALLVGIDNAPSLVDKNHVRRLFGQVSEFFFRFPKGLLSDRTIGYINADANDILNRSHTI